MEWTDVVPSLRGLAHLATADTDGTPHASVVMAGVDGDHLWIATDRTSKKARNLAANPRIAIFWQPEEEAYVSGSVELLDDADTKQHVWDGEILPYDPARFFGSVDNPDLLMVKVNPETAIVQRVGPGGGTVERWSRAD